MVAHTFILGTLEAQAGDHYDFETRLVYRVSSRTAKSTLRNCVMKNWTNKIKNQTVLV